MYGGIGCLGTPVVRTDAAAIWATGQTWWQIPPVASVALKGTLLPGVTGKDVIITLCGFFNHDEVLNCIVEFWGEGISELSIDERLTIANMTTEWGALAGVFPVDEKTLAWLERRCDFVERRGLAGVASDIDAIRGRHPRMNRHRLDELKGEIMRLHPDDDAFYAKELILDLNSVEPYVSGPDTVKDMRPISSLRAEKIKVDKAYLVSCVNSRVADLAAAAEVVRGRKIAETVRFYLSAASDEVQKESERRGDWQALLDAGAIELPPGCGPCIGLGEGTLEDGEVGISATNRNFKGRMGSRNAHTYLASPAVVAASALAGYIDYPGGWNGGQVKGELTVNRKKPVTPANVAIIKGFPESISGELLFCHQDNLNTDGIYPGRYTYQDNITPEKQAEVVMENYDPDFRNIAKRGDILVGGFNFGTGSSREQAATALKHCGIQLVLAGSFSETYKRNALNNGFLAIESPELIERLKRQFGTEKFTVRTAIHATVDFKHSRLQVGGTLYKIDPIGIPAQELVVAGGLENWVQAKI
jgi:homoaconitate hydratase